MEKSSLLLILLCNLVAASFATQNVDRSALLIVDVQNCFTEGGTLAVPNGNDVIPVINDIRARFESRFDLVVLSQDWHCPDHVSFASQHQRYDVFDTKVLQYNVGNGKLCRSENVTLPYAVSCEGQTSSPLEQTLWPDHCVSNTTDAEIHPALTVRDSDVIVRKGWNCELDSYSVFYDNGRFDETALRQILLENNITAIYIAGLATDYCVYWTAKDSLELGFETSVIVDASRGIDPQTTRQALDDMKASGIILMNSTDLDIPEPVGSSANDLVSKGVIACLVLWVMTLSTWH